MVAGNAKGDQPSDGAIPFRDHCPGSGMVHSLAIFFSKTLTLDIGRVLTEVMEEADQVPQLASIDLGCI
jgi:hypothetical protein